MTGASSLKLNFTNKIALIVIVALAFSATIVAMSVNVSERAYDFWVPNYDQVALVVSEVKIGNQDPILSTEIPGPFAQRLSSYTDLNFVSIVRREEVRIIVKGGEIITQVDHVDDNFSKIFPLFPGIIKPDEVVITRKLANSNSLEEGGILQISSEAGIRSFRIKHIIDTSPGRSHLDASVFLRLDQGSFPENGFVFQNWGSLAFRMYVLKIPGANFSDIQISMNKILNSGIATALGPEVASNFRISPIIIPLRDIANESARLSELKSVSPGGLQYAKLLLVAAVCVLVTALGIFIIFLLSVISAKQSSLAIRRFYGWSGTKIIVDIISVVLEICICGMFLGLVLYYIFSTLFLDITNPLSFLISSRYVIFYTLILALFTLFIFSATFVLAVMVTANDSVLRNKYAGVRVRLNVQKVFAALQITFASLAIFLFLGWSEQLRIEKDNLSSIVPDSTFILSNLADNIHWNNLDEVIRDSHPNVDIGFSNFSPNERARNLDTLYIEGGGRSVSVDRHFVSPYFFNLLGANVAGLIEGDFVYKGNRSKDSQASNEQSYSDVVVTSSVADNLGLSVNELLNRTIGRDAGGDSGQVRIVGIVEDFGTRPKEEKVPSVFYPLPTEVSAEGWLVIKNEAERKEIELLLRQVIGESGFTLTSYKKLENTFYKAEALAARQLFVLAGIGGIIGILSVFAVAASIVSGRKLEILIESQNGAPSTYLVRKYIGPIFGILVFSSLFGVLVGVRLVKNHVGGFWSVAIIICLITLSFLPSIRLISRLPLNSTTKS